MTRAKQTLIIFTFAFFGLTACNHSSQTNSSEKQPLAVDTPKIEAESGNDSLVYDYSYFPNDSTFSVKVLTTGTFHGDEVWNNADKEKWFGIFKGKKGVYLAETKVKTRKVHDGIVDENEDEHSGVEVTVTNKDTCVMLVQNLSYLADKPIQSIDISEGYIYPGDTFSFKYLGVDYQIFAIGGRKTHFDPDWIEVWNYKLYISAIINGVTYQTLLVAQPNFDDHMISLIFAGDIDGDKILDLIIETSRHYNTESPTLYLSRPANKGEIVKPIGSHTTTGC